MLGISGTELVIILFFGFLIFGPEKLPQMGRTVGRAIRQFRQASETMNKKFQDEVKDPFEEAVAPVRDAVNEAGSPIRDDISAINNNLNDIKSTITNPFKEAMSPAAGKQGSTSSHSTAPAQATVVSAAKAASTAPAPSPAQAEPEHPAPADEAYQDPFADIANDDAPSASDAGEAPADSGSGEPAGIPLPETGGTVKKSIAASLYDLDGAPPAPEDAPADEKGGE